MKRYALFLDGEFHETAQHFDDVSPVDGRIVAQVCTATAADVDRAVAAARRAQPAWAALGPLSRAETLRRVAALLTERFDAFLQAEVADTGKPQALAKALDIPRGAANFRTFADLVAVADTHAFQ
ncbi:MAG TPA: aldehyde dehydrogenase family protein, partial [Candidatus Xenobia bacterium]